MKNIFEKSRKYYSAISMLCIFFLTLFSSFSWIEPEGLYNLNSPQYLQVSSINSNSESSDSELKVLTGKSLNGNENKKLDLQSATEKKIDVNKNNVTINNISSKSERSTVESSYKDHTKDFCHDECYRLFYKRDQYNQYKNCVQDC